MRMMSKVDVIIFGPAMIGMVIGLKVLTDEHWMTNFPIAIFSITLVCSVFLFFCIARIGPPAYSFNSILGSSVLCVPSFILSLIGLFNFFERGLVFFFISILIGLSIGILILRWMSKSVIE